MLDTPIEDHIDMRTINLRPWVKQIYPVAQKGIQDANEQIRKGVQDMRNFSIRITILHQEPSGPFFVSSWEWEW
jgi:hypothetical protein